MMQKWQIRTSLCAAIRRPVRSPPQCTFSTSQSRLDDDERPRSNRQASAKAGRLIANLNTRGAPERTRDPDFGLRGLKPYDGQARNGTADTATKTFTIRKIGAEYPENGRKNTSTDRSRQSSDRSAPRRNDYSSRQRNPATSSDRSSPGRPQRDGRSGQYSASNRDRGGRYGGSDDSNGDKELAALEEEEEEEDDLQALVEEEERLATPVQQEWEVMNEDGEIVDELEDGEEVGDEIDEDEEGDHGPEELDMENDEDAVAKWEQSAYEGMEMAQKQLDGGPVPYNPKPMKAEELHTSFVTTGAGELGVAAAAKQAMGRLGRRADLDYHYDAELASRLYRGDVVRFRDAEEKKRAMWMAEEFASNTANRIMEKKGEWEPKIDVGFVPVPEKAKEAIAGKAMRGIYPTMPIVQGELSRAGASDQEKTMAHLRRSVLLNETYSPTQGKSMVDFIAKLWPAETLSKPTQSDERKRA